MNCVRYGGGNGFELDRATGNIMCWNKGYAIELEHVKWAAINGNEFIDSGGTARKLKCGILLPTDVRGVQIVGNTVFNWEGHLPMEYGIKEDADCRENLIMEIL